MVTVYEIYVHACMKKEVARAKNKMLERVIKEVVEDVGVECIGQGC